MSEHTTDGLRWTHRPMEADLPVRYPLRRVGAKGLEPVVVLSGDVLGIYTHFFRGRTHPCMENACEACKANHAPRWHGYLWVYNPRNEAMGILEITAAAITPLDKWFKQHRTLKGVSIKCDRVPKRPNGRLYIHCSESGYNSKDLPTPDSLKKILLNIFGMNELPRVRDGRAAVVNQPLVPFTGTDE